MTGKSKRGFASMDRARQREIAAKGGRAAHAKGTAHVWSAEEAREAGRKGGEIVSQDRLHMSAIGKEGGESRSAAVRAARVRRTAEQAAARAAASMDREVPVGGALSNARLNGHTNGLAASLGSSELADRASATNGRDSDRTTTRALDRTIERARDRSADRPLDRATPALEQRDMA